MTKTRAARTKSGLPAAIAALTEAAIYPHRPAQVELRQTHISYVFMAGEYVYKIKKPVHFPFVDYSTLKRRAHFCREELRLNRRLASDVYLRVVPLIKREQAFALAEETVTAGKWTVVDYAVKMRRLPEDLMLDQQLSASEVRPGIIQKIARTLAKFHATTAITQAPLYGAPEVIARAVAENFQETETFVGRTISEERFYALQEYNRHFLAEHQELLKARVREERVCEGHGDLRAEHICLTDPLVIFDCIEFNERLRYGDVASEIAFLAMDLDFLDAPALSAALTSMYGSLTHDKELPVLLPFYQCYRAYVRGKVESLKSLEEEIPDAERARAQMQARRYFCLATRYATAPVRPCVLLVCGLAATGKSTLARLLGDRTGFAVLHSDVTRKALAGVPATTPSGAAYQADLYNQNFTQLTYNTLLSEAEKRLQSGQGIIVDATFKDAAHRWLFVELATRMHLPMLFIECHAEEKEIAARLEKRKHDPNAVSDATWDVYLRQRQEFVPLTEIPDRCHLLVDTTTDLEQAIAQVEATFV